MWVGIDRGYVVYEGHAVGVFSTWERLRSVRTYIHEISYSCGFVVDCVMCDVYYVWFWIIFVIVDTFVVLL